jgi:hypothetical protein
MVRFEVVFTSCRIDFFFSSEKKEITEETIERAAIFVVTLTHAVLFGTGNFVAMVT